MLRGQPHSTRPVRCEVSKGVEDGRRPPALQADHPRNVRKAISGVARLQGVSGLVWASRGETLGRPWIPLPTRPCTPPSLCQQRWKLGLRIYIRENKMGLIIFLILDNSISVPLPFKIYAPEADASLPRRMPPFRLELSVSDSKD
jgi:hypothetical protein